MSPTLTDPTPSTGVIDLRDPGRPMPVGIVGLGYVGLPTALSLTEAGHRVIGVDVSEARLDAIARGEVDLLPEDRARLRALNTAGGLTTSTDAEALTAADAVIVCVPTPVSEQLVPDLEPLRSAARSVVAHARAGQVIIMTSTTYVGCTQDLLVGPLRERGFTPGEDVHVAFSPERIDPGVADHRPESTPRVVGGLTPACTEAAAGALRGTCPALHLVSGVREAEMSKLLENTFRAVNIAMINEFANAAREYALDITEVIDAASTKPYGFMRFTPGPGVGGHCIPCDPHYLLWHLRSRDVTLPVIDAAMEHIMARPRQVVARVIDELARIGRPLAEATVHIAGVAYKPGVQDVRESPALRIAAHLVERGVGLEFSDPLVESFTAAGVQVPRADLATTAADVVLVHTAGAGTIDPRTISSRVGVVLDATYTLTDQPNVCAV